jgi:hypothetical protein
MDRMSGNEKGFRMGWKHNLIKLGLKLELA